MKRVAGPRTDMRILYLCNNPNLVSTARILQSWLLRSPEQGIQAYAVAAPGAFAGWLRDQRIDHLVDAMRWPDRRWPIPGLWHVGKVALWARRRRIDIIHCNEHDV